MLFVFYLSVVSVGGAELGVRLLALAPPVPLEYVRYTADDILPFRPPVNDRWMQSGAGGEFEVEVRTNSLGFRDVEHSREKPGNVFRVLALGDSFTFGIGASFEDTYLVRLEEKLNARSGVHPVIEVIKAGIPRFWPEPQTVLLERIGVGFDPDLVLVSFLPNDVADTVAGMDYLEVSEGFLLTRQADRLGRGRGCGSSCTPMPRVSSYSALSRGRPRALGRGRTTRSSSLTSIGRTGRTRLPGPRSRPSISG